MRKKPMKLQEVATSALEASAKWLRSLGTKAPSEQSPSLLPLTPKYDPAKHGIYFDVIEAALSDPAREVRNIALTGSYGVGKSSILTEVAARHSKDVIAVSLSTLGFPDDEPLPAGDAAKAASTKTNRIQKEIVKQLLYSQDPLKTPGSRYHRTTRFRFWRTLRLSALLSLSIALVFFLAGWTTTIASLVPGSDDAAWLGHAVVFSGSTLLLLGFFAVFHNRIQIEKLGAGAATISLSAKSATYFDEYLDEIVYFFEVVKRDIVIFEDIDRFDDAHIFETLRSLNSILNGAHQLKGRKIRFIYAIKDSIFDELGTRAAKEEISGGEEQLTEEKKPTAKGVRQDATEAEIARANRTKFFDLVVPVVPFITHRSARDLLVQTLGSDLQHGVSDELIDLAAKYVADMRLIKNVRNEYAIFKRQIIDTGSLELSEDHLFAMVLYKSTHLSDFELIKLGKSNLDTLYRDGRTLVNDNIRALSTSIRSARQSRPTASISPTEAQELGDLLIEHIARTFRHLGLTPQHDQQMMAGEDASNAVLRTSAFWEKFAATDGTVEVQHYRSQLGRYEVVSFSRKDVAEALGRQIESADWIARERERIDKNLANAVADRDFLAHADMSDLMARSDFKVKVDEMQVSFDELAKQRLTSEMAVRLVEAGYIDRNFTLYTSTFYSDRVSANATNFILKNVDPNVVDLYFALDHAEVEAVLRERGRSVLSERAAYNISIVDYLVTNDRAGVDLLIGRLLRTGEDELELLHAYLDGGAHAAELVSALAPRWDGIFSFVVDAGLKESVARKLIDAAIRVSSGDITYGANERVRDFLVASYRELDVFVSAQTSATDAARAAALVSSTEVLIPALQGLAPAVLAALVTAGDYALTRDNLLVALGEAGHSLSLDAIKASSEEVYERVLDDVTGYLAVLETNDVTVTEDASFVAVLEDVLKADAAQLPAVIGRASTECAVTTLTDVSSDVWEPLAEHDRFPLSFPNVKSYVDEVGLDEHLTRRLGGAGKIETEDGADEAEKTALARELLGATAEFPSAKRRAELAGSLRLKEYLEASTIPSPTGEYVGWLIAEEIIEDDATAFAVIPAADVDGLAFAISKSDNVADFMSPTQIGPAAVGAVVAHDLVPPLIKQRIVARFTEFTGGTSRAGLTIVARYATDSGLDLTFDEVLRLSQEGVDPALVLALLQNHLPSLGAAELALVLVPLGGEYEKLSVANGKHPHVPATHANRALVARLDELDIVSTYGESYGEIRAHMKQS